MLSLIDALKHHDSFNDDSEVLSRAKALESLLLTLADVFSFYNKKVDYEEVVSLITEH